MALSKAARVASVERTSAGTCVLELEVGEPLGFVGGQYIIVDSGLVLPSGKAAKRAYSILTSDADQRRFRLAVKRIPNGPVSAFMHELSPGATLAFSGPWGKLGPEVCAVCGADSASMRSASGTQAASMAPGADAASGAQAASMAPGAGREPVPRVEPVASGTVAASGASPTASSTDGSRASCTACERGVTLVLATDTGISAALGLVQARRMHSRLPATVLLWLQVSGESFLPETLVRSQIPAGCTTVRFAVLPPVGHPERVPHMRTVLAGELLQARSRGGVARAYITGDGAVNYALLDDLVAAGIPATRDSVESFFNMPKKSA